MNELLQIAKSVFLSRVFVFGVAILIGVVGTLGYKSGQFDELITAYIPDQTEVLSDSDETAVLPTATQAAESNQPAATPPATTSQPLVVVETDAKHNKTAEGRYSADGKRQGEWKFFYSGGQVRSTGNYTNDKRVGSWRFYHPNGKVMAEGRYTDSGAKTGNWTSYYASGYQKSEGSYKDGLKIGEWYGWPYDGHDDYYWHGVYAAGERRHGDWRWYAAGTVRVVERYNNGQLVQTWNGNGFAPAISR